MELFVPTPRASAISSPTKSKIAPAIQIKPRIIAAKRELKNRTEVAVETVFEIALPTAEVIELVTLGIVVGKLFTACMVVSDVPPGFATNPVPSNELVSDVIEIRVQRTVVKVANNSPTLACCNYVRYSGTRQP